MTQTALATADQVFDCALHGSAYPWEALEAEQPREWRASPLRPLLTQCLARDAAARPTAAGFTDSVASLDDAGDCMMRLGTVV